MASKNLEFVVQMSCDSCAKIVEKSLENVPGIESCDVNLREGSVSVQTTLSPEEILKLLHSTGKKAAVRVMDGDIAAVALLDTGSDIVKGVVRFLQEPDACVVEGTIYGLQMGVYRLSVHENGDTSAGCDGVGECLNPDQHQEEDRKYGDLGIFLGERGGRSAFVFDDTILKVSDIVAKTLVVSEARTEKKLACGAIGKSPAVFQYPKSGCSCNDEDV